NQRAIQAYEQFLSVARDLGERRDECVALINLGVAYSDLGQTEQAIQFYEKYLTIAREIGDRRGEGIALWNISLVLYERGERAQAVECAEAALMIHEQIEDPSVSKIRAVLSEWRDGTTGD